MQYANLSDTNTIYLLQLPPRISHMKVVREILIYLNGTIDYDNFFPSSLDDIGSVITCYSNSNWWGEKFDRRSTTCYFSKVLGAPILWCSRNNQRWHCPHVRQSILQALMLHAKESNCFATRQQVNYQLS